MSSMFRGSLKKEMNNSYPASYVSRYIRIMSKSKGNIRARAKRTGIAGHQPANQQHDPMRFIKITRRKRH